MQGRAAGRQRGSCRRVVKVASGSLTFFLFRMHSFSLFRMHSLQDNGCLVICLHQEKGTYVLTNMATPTKQLALMVNCEQQLRGICVPITAISVRVVTEYRTTIAADSKSVTFLHFRSIVVSSGTPPHFGQ